jgi:hypothetical protein
MTSSQKRRMLIIGILGVLFAAGGGCLAYLATASSGTSATGVSTEGAGETGPSGLASPDGSSRTGSSSGGNDTAPPKPGRSVNVNGVDLGGGGGVGCFNLTIQNTQVPVTITTVGVSSKEGNATRSSGCPTGEGPSCAGARLNGGDSCTVGIRVTGSSESNVTVTLAGHATCTSATPVPCNEPQVARLSPSAANPVRINWRATRTKTVTAAEDPDSPPADDQDTPEPPDPPEPPDSPEPPDPQEAPESEPSGLSS